MVDESEEVKEIHTYKELEPSSKKINREDDNPLE